MKVLSIKYFQKVYLLKLHDSLIFVATYVQKDLTRYSKLFSIVYFRNKKGIMAWEWMNAE